MSAVAPLTDSTARAAPSGSHLALVLGTSLAVQTGASLASQALAPLAPFLQAELGLSRAAVGLLTAAVYLGSLLSLVPAGGLCDRLGARRLFLLGPLALGAALVGGALGGTYAVLLGALVLAGVANGVALPPTTRAIVDWFPPARRGLPMGIKQTGVALAGTLAALLAPPLALAFGGWRGALAALGLAAATVGGLAWLGYRDPPDLRARRADILPAGLHALLRDRPLMLLCAASFLLAAVQLALVSFLVLFLRDRLGYAAADGARLLALAQASGVVGRVAWGSASDHLFGGDHRRTLLCIAVGSAGCLGGLSLAEPGAPVALLALLVALAGASAIGWNGVSMLYVAALAGHQQAARAAGLNLTCCHLGIVLAPPLVGALLDASGSYALGFRVLAGGSLLAAALLAAIRSAGPRSAAASERL
ncbi:MAG TPA: MFS transporter [Chloroflexota bacterium]|nr:MFS transporter [Chloroflexota bacterium]